MPSEGRSTSSGRLNSIAFALCALTIALGLAPVSSATLSMRTSDPLGAYGYDLASSTYNVSGGLLVGRAAFDAEAEHPGRRPVTASRGSSGAIGYSVVAANAGARMADGLIGVPQAPMSRALARLQGLRLGDEGIVQGVDAFGSRAGSTFRGRGPTAGS